MNLRLRLTTGLSFIALASGLSARVVLAPLFSDHAVVQRDKVIPIWGRAEPREKVTVKFAGQTRTATTGADGRWVAFLDAIPGTAIGADLSVTGKNVVIVRDVVVGEVWLCSGQSNMEFRVDRAADAAKEIAAANFPLLRHVDIRNTVAAAPADQAVTSGWEAATPQSAGNFTAVGYFFAREIQAKLGVPIGIINSSWGGTPIESWMSPATLADPAFKFVAERWAQTLAEFPTKKTAYDRTLADWTQADAAAKAGPKDKYAAWQKLHPRPRGPRGPGDSWTPAGLYNGMIRPLEPYALRGILWYQGESNAIHAGEYRALFSAMITGWRAQFGQGDVPFYWVNLANYTVPDDPTGRTYAFLREAQTQTLSLPNTGQALAIDLGDPNDIHPTNKQEVGHRLALLAKNEIYDIYCDDVGPSFASATREGAALRVRFTHVESGLVAHDKPPQALEIAGADRVFRAAFGRIERDTLVITSPAVQEPVAVRYAWSNAPQANLYSGAGLPVVPFRSDTW